MKSNLLSLCLLAFVVALVSCNRPAPSSVSQSALGGPSPNVSLPKSGFDADEQISEYIRRIFRDSKGRLWMGTNGDGVFMHDGKQLKQYTVEQGLAGRQVTGILEAELGHIWVATDEGLSAFDGMSFKNYTTNEGLPSNRLWSILRDRKGVIWAGTESGLCRLEGEKFVKLELPDWEVKGAEPSWALGAIRCLAEDSKGDIWIGVDGMGVLIYDGANFKQLSTKDGLCDNSVTCILTDQKGKTWISSMFGGVSCYDGKRFVNFSMENGRIGGNECWTMMGDHAGNIWFSCEGFGVYRFDGQTLTNFWERDGLMVKAVQTIHEDKPGRIWVGGGGGLYRYEGKGFLNVKKGGPWE